MKTLVVLCACLALVVAQEAAPEKAPEEVAETSAAPPASSATASPAPGQELNVKVYTRDLPADQLRDFPGLCFASTRCEVKKVGESWPLHPFCGTATCLVADAGYLVERVQDCGPLPKANPKCKVANVNDTAEPFPVCCPQFECEEGVQLEYPTPEELAGQAEGKSAETPSPNTAESETAAPVSPPTEVTSEGSTTASADVA